MVWGFVFLSLAVAGAVLIVARIARKGPESGLPRCSTCAGYEGCACDRPKTKSQPLDGSLKENEDDRRAN